MLNIYFKTLDSATLPILEKLREKRYYGIKCWLKQNDIKKVIHIRDANIIQHCQTNNHLTCYCWDISNCMIYPEYDGLEHLIWRHLEQNEKFVCIDNRSHCNNQIVLFQDAPQLKDYPKEFVKVPSFHQIEDLIEYALAEGVFSFTLNDPNRFEKYNGISPIQGASVYKELSTGYYWYIDMLHKNHYEVFDHTGNHLGEADLNGILDTTQKDTTKRISL